MHPARVAGTMRRREFLATGVAVALAGCGSNADGSTRRTTGGGMTARQTTDERTATPALTPVETGRVELSTRLENRDGVQHTVDVETTHLRRPVCSFEDPPCGEPDRTETLIEGDRTVQPGGRAEFPSVSFDVAPDVVDVLNVTATFDGERRGVSLVEDGASLLMGEAFDVTDYTRRFRPGNQLCRIIVFTGEVQVGVFRAE